MKIASTIAALAVTSFCGPALAAGWTEGFERGTYYHTLTLDDLKMIVVCDAEGTRGKNAGYITVEAGGNDHIDGTLAVSLDGKAASTRLEYGSAFEKTNPTAFKAITDRLAAAGAITVSVADKEWSFTNPKPVNLHCK
ncbi:hypothetical protein [Paracoccus kondratievae]|uniref:Excinuclease ABC subunit A n=1 Tax=Paracoccus kondratievae TaxID=135740 RepID=A0AAD3NYZ6_9RHOB|nr:hypothetical protein [Paracoccus kondratievae]GLK65171.1 hypothetical protein GCM10017635_26420 [Paracoccus kondratievae]